MEHITCDISDHIATVTLHSLTMPPAFFGQCERLFDQLAADDDLRAVVICAAGKAFSYGLDLRAAFAEKGSLMAIGGMAGERMKLLRMIRELQRSFTVVADCPVPVIAAVHGWCIGGGLDLISACDIRLASADAVFSLRETRIALVADLGSLQRLPRIIGQGHARELAFTGKDIGAEHAARIGLVNQVLADRDATIAAAQAMARDIAHNAPLTVRGVKQVLDFGADKTVAEGLEYVAAWNSAFLASRDLGEAVAAFMTKRPPLFKGE